MIGKTRNDGERILERPVHKIVFLKESKIWLPDKDTKCQDDLTPWEDPVLLQTLCRRDCIKDIWNGETCLCKFFVFLGF